MNPLIPKEVLARTQKLLCITHLGIGDYVYLQTYFKSLLQAYPHLSIDLWVDEVRRTWCFWRWKNLKSYSLYDWVTAAPYFNNVYTQTYSPPALYRFLWHARQQKYPVVVSFATLRSHRYARYARFIAPKGLVGGVVNTKKELHRSFDAVVVRPDDKSVTSTWHINDFYAYYFEQLFGLHVSVEKRFPRIDIPSQWHGYGAQWLRTKGMVAGNGSGKIVFINPEAKTPKRCWPLKHVATLINLLQKQPTWKDAHFIVNALPLQRTSINHQIRQWGLKHTHVFSADENFFQLPSLLACCDLVISVETAIMHLATALHIPVVALMRRKNPEWVPYDRSNSCVVFARGRGWVRRIPPKEVAERADEFYQKLTPTLLRNDSFDQLLL